MVDLMQEIAKADEIQIGDLLQAAMRRYNELNAEWEVSLISLKKSSDINEQLDRNIAFLQNLKTKT